MTTPDDISAYRSRYSQSRVAATPPPPSAPAPDTEPENTRDPNRPYEAGRASAHDPRWDDTPAPARPQPRPAFGDYGQGRDAGYGAPRPPQRPAPSGPHAPAPRPDDGAGGFSLPSRRGSAASGASSRGDSGSFDDYGAEPDSFIAGAKQALPSTGWRRFAARTLHLPVGKSAKEVETDGWIATMRRPLLSSKLIGVIGGKGGVGKTSIGVAIASMLSVYRSKAVCIVTLDYNNTLGQRTRSRDGAARPGVNLHEFATDPGVETPQEVSGCMDANAHRLNVLGTGLNALKPNAMTPQQFNDALAKLKRNYELVFVDFGNSPTDVYWQAIASLDEMILVSSTESDAMRTSRELEAQIREAGMSELVDQATVGVLNHRSSADPRADLTKYVGHRGALNRREVVEVPWDAHLSESGTVNLELLDKMTYRQVMLAAAAVMATLPA